MYRVLSVTAPYLKSWHTSKCSKECSCLVADHNLPLLFFFLSRHLLPDHNRAGAQLHYMTQAGETFALITKPVIFDALWNVKMKREKYTRL